MKKQFSKILMGTIICAASTVAFASGDSYNRSTGSFIKDGWSIGIDGGYGYLSSPEAFYPNDFSVATDGTVDTYTASAEVGDWVWGVHIARDFRISTNMLLGLELGYKDLGDANNHINHERTTNRDNIIHEYNETLNRDYSQNAVDFLLTAHYYLWQGLNIFGKAGVAYVQSDTNQFYDNTFPIEDGGPIIEPLNGDNDIWRLEPEFSLGVGYMFKCNIDIHAAYTYIGGANDQPIATPENAMFLPKAKVYSTNMVMAGISYTF